MLRFRLGMLCLTVMAGTGCASYPVPVQRMADAEAAARSAQDLGASTSPQGQLHLKLAQEEIAQAQQLIANKDNERADYVLIRAKSDAELAVAEAKDTTAEQEARLAQAKIAEMGSGSPSASVTTTTNTSSAPATTTVSPSPSNTTTSTSTKTTVSGGHR